MRPRWRWSSPSSTGGAWLTPRRLFQALSAGVRGVLPVAAVRGAAGIITATTTKTGLGAQFATLLVRGAQALSDNPTAVLAFTAVFAAVVLSLFGLAVPVTASFIIGWVIIGPALLALGVPAPAAAMWQALKYALPAFLAPIAFVLTRPGEYLLGRGPLWLVAGAALVA